MCLVLNMLSNLMFLKAQLKTSRVTVELRKEWLGSRTGPMPTTVAMFLEALLQIVYNNHNT